MNIIKLVIMGQAGVNAYDSLAKTSKGDIRLRFFVKDEMDYGAKQCLPFFRKDDGPRTLTEIREEWKTMPGSAGVRNCGSWANC